MLSKRSVHPSAYGKTLLIEAMMAYNGVAASSERWLAYYWLEAVPFALALFIFCYC